MAKIGLVLKSSIPAALELARTIISWAEKNGHAVLVEESSKNGFKNCTTASAQEIIDQADPVISLGGDGTLLGVARLIKQHSPVLLGVNFGRLGFLTEIAPEGIIQSLEQTLSGAAPIANRSMLKVECFEAGKCIFSEQALNDVVVQKEARAGLLELDVFVEEHDLMRIRGDGLIFSTPTGSTAYSMAAGGSIAYPSLEITLVTPICPHSLTYRPLIIPNDLTARVRIPEYDSPIYVTVDGQVSCEIKTGVEVVITRAAATVRFARSASSNYFSILRNKLNWGIANKAQ